MLTPRCIQRRLLGTDTVLRNVLFKADKKPFIEVLVMFEGDMA